MTPFERTHPKQINGSRRARIAKGSGVQVSEVNALLERFTDAQKMMKQLARGGGIPGMPGMPGMGGGRKGKQQQQRKKSKSGNPAKRAAEERAAAEKAKAAKTSGAGAFGGGAEGENGGMPADFDPANLPKGFEKFLGR